MPEVAAFIASTGIQIGALEITTSQLLLAAATFSYTTSQRRRMERRARNAFNNSLRDRTLTVRGTLEERELVMGRVRKGGFFYPVGTTGADSERMVFIVVMAGHSISAVNTVYFDENPLTIDSNGWVTSAPYVDSKKLNEVATLTLSAGAGSVSLPYTPVSGSVSVTVETDINATQAVTHTVSGSTVSVTGFGTYSGPATVTYQRVDNSKRYARVRWMMGGDSQAAFADLITDFPTLWTSAHRLRGCAYAVVELTYSQDIFPGGIPNFSADISGADTVYDPRSTTTGYSANPALLARWYLLHPLGGRRTTAQIDEASIIAAANVCDTSVNYGAGATPLYQAGYVAKAGDQPADVLDELTEAMAGLWGYTQGRVRLRAGAVGTPVASITSDWLLTRQMTTRARRPRSELRNVLQGTFSDAANNYQPLQFTRVADTAAISSDGAELVGDVEFQAITRNGQAQQVAACMLRYERQALVVTLVLKMRAWPLQLFDVVSLTLADMGWSGKLFEVLDRSFALGGGVKVTLKEIDASIYTFGTSFPTTDPAPNTELPDPRSVPTIGALTVTSSAAALADGTVRTKVDISWPAITDAGVTRGGFVEVGWADLRGTPVLAVQRADSISGHSIVGELAPGVHHIFVARAVNGAGVLGDWSLPNTHRVAGKSATPANVAGLTATAAPGGVLITVTPSTDPDVRAGGNLELRVGASWAAGTRILRAPVDRYTWPWPAAGTYTIRAKWIDRSGNESAADASVGIVVNDGNLIATNQVAPGAFTKTAMQESAGPYTGIANAAAVTLTPAVVCDAVVTVEMNFECTNSTGAAALIYGVFNVGYDDGSSYGAYADRYVSQTLAAGQTIRFPVSIAYRFASIPAAVAQIWSAVYSDHGSSVLVGKVSDLRTRVELIYR